MFSLMLQKLLHKKWMVLCVLTGMIFLIAVAVSNPMYRNAAFQRMLVKGFDQYWEENKEWPAGFSVERADIRRIAAEGIGETKEAVDKAVEEIGIPVKEYVAWYELKEQKGQASVIRDGRKDKTIRLAAISDLENHVEIVAGQMPQPDITADGCLEVMASEAAMVRLDLLLGDEYSFSSLEDTDGKRLTVKVVGVFRAKDDSDIYWVEPDSELTGQVFLNADTFQRLFFTKKGESAKFSVTAKWYVFWDYEKMKVSQIVSDFNAYKETILASGLNGTTNADAFQSVVAEYSAKAKQIETILIILQMPVMLLLCAFLYMISGQMLQMEQSEISLMKSRGAARGQIVGLYFMQSGVLALIALAIGLPLGRAFCELLGSTGAFLEFTKKTTLHIEITPEVLLYGLAAAAIAIGMITLPVIKYSGVSIVNLKQSRMKKKKSLWKKVYLDVICLALSLYGYYSFQKRDQQLMEGVLSGQSLDPLLYVSFSIFILGFGLLLCRLQPLLMKLLYKIFGRWFKPAAYASVLQTIRTGYKQEFIILFMILTVAIGISDTTLSGTILANTKANIEHTVGADAVLSEVWKDNARLYYGGLAADLEYYEPDYSKYQNVEGVEASTKVFVRMMQMESTQLKASVELMGIQTRGFSQVTSLQEGLLLWDYYDYLNVLAGNSDGFLVSENFMTELGYKLGDVIVLRDSMNQEVKGYIRGFFQYWPGYEPYLYQADEAGMVVKQSNYLIVGNLSQIQEAMGVEPYQVWLKFQDGGAGFQKWMEDNPDVVFKSAKIADQMLNEKKADALLQGTNGILSMSFIIILLLCCVGYLIYWIMSIRSRELLFGVLRAMGMKKKEIIWMLVIEQICSGLYAVLAGTGIGIVSSGMFVPMIQKAYATTEQVLPLELILRASDVMKLLMVVLVVLCVCLMVLGKIISKMNISNALKLGED